ncbi:MAG: hypothetical protein FLDDKLPJ_01069 [Phycisphaerae bacterium]|nr:hypothetical protein [Phycisphaerae bacterium]
MLREDFERSLGEGASRSLHVALRDGPRIKLPPRIRYWICPNVRHIGIFKGRRLDRTVTLRYEDVETVEPRGGANVRNGEGGRNRTPGKSDRGKRA